MMFANTIFRIRNSIRAFANTPGISIALLMTIAIGVGSNASVVGFIAGLAHPRVSDRNSGQIVSLFARDRLSDAGLLSESEYQAIRNHNAEFSWVDAVRIAPLDVDFDGHSGVRTVAGIMPDLANALGLHLKNGVVLSDHQWHTEFGDARGEIAGQMRINDHELPITGVAPKTVEGLYGDRPIDLWMPYEDSAPRDANPERPDLWVFASLRPGVSPSRAQREIRAGFQESKNVDVIPYSGIAPETAGGLASIVTLLSFIAGSVFLISCINVASLLVGRAFERSSETSLRVALGATRRALSGELLSDSTVIALAGGILGLLVAIGAKRVIPNLLFEKDAEQIIFVPPVASLITSSVVCVAITVLAGMMPILATVTDRPWTVLQREQGWSSTKVARLRGAFIVLQIAICCSLVIFATLLLEGFQNALKTGIGHKLGNPILVTVQAIPPPAGNPAAYFKAVEQSSKSVANVAPVAWTTELPGSQPDWQSFRLQPVSLPQHEIDLDIVEFPADDEGLASLQPTAGRRFEVRDQSCRVALVDGAAADALSGRATVGERIFDPDGQPVEIIGVLNKGPSADLHNRRPAIFLNPFGPNAHAAIKGAKFRAPAASSWNDIDLNVNFVSSGYMQALGLSLMGGHWFPAAPQYPNQCRPVGVVNQEASNLYFGGRPLGAEIIDQNGGQIKIIGIVRSPNLGTFQKHAEPTVFLPAWQESPLRMTLILRASHPSDQTLGNCCAKLRQCPGGTERPISKLWIRSCPGRRLPRCG